MLASSTGCHLWEITHEPIVRNPFPQLSRVAVAPFFNQSDEPTVDGREVAMAYFAELQATPGFEVVPLGVVEDAILAHRVDLANAGEARRLANILGVDVVVIGSVTDFTPYYPPRCGMRVEWYAANPGFHPIPPGYGLPWGTPEEEFIPQPLVFEAEFALAKAQFAQQTPDCPKPPLDPPPGNDVPHEPGFFLEAPSVDGPARDRGPAKSLPRENESDDDRDQPEDGDDMPTNTGADEPAFGRDNSPGDSEIAGVIHTAYATQVSEEELPTGELKKKPLLPPQSPPSSEGDTTGTTGAREGEIMSGPRLPDHSAFCSQSACNPGRAPCLPYNGPIMTHTRMYQGNDSDFAAALETYCHFRTDARFGGWETYLQRSDDFIRFCCHLHIREMLSARGGADQTRVRWEWSDCR